MQATHRDNRYINNIFTFALPVVEYIGAGAAATRQCDRLGE